MANELPELSTDDFLVGWVIFPDWDRFTVLMKKDLRLYLATLFGGMNTYLVYRMSDQQTARIMESHRVLRRAFHGYHLDVHIGSRFQKTVNHTVIKPNDHYGTELSVLNLEPVAYFSKKTLEDNLGESI